MKWYQINQTLHVIDYKRFKYQPYKELYRIEEFLKLEHKISAHDIVFNETKRFFCKRDKIRGEVCMRGDKGRKHPPIPPQHYRMFQEYFRENNERFFQAIGQDFGWNDDIK